MTRLHNPGSALSIPLDTGVPVTAPRTPNGPKIKRVPYDLTKIPRSLYFITTEKHLRRRIPSIEEKKHRNHEYRNSLSTPERRGICDWCDIKRENNPLHFF